MNLWACPIFSMGLCLHQSKEQSTHQRPVHSSLRFLQSIVASLRLLQPINHKESSSRAPKPLGSLPRTCAFDGRLGFVFCFPVFFSLGESFGCDWYLPPGGEAIFCSLWSGCSVQLLLLGAWGWHHSAPSPMKNVRSTRINSLPLAQKQPGLSQEASPFFFPEAVLFC